MKKTILSMLVASMVLIGCGHKGLVSNISPTNGKLYSSNQLKVGRVVQTLTAQNQSLSRLSVQNPELPSWLLISSNDVSSISIQGWGPGAGGNFAMDPATGSSTRLINTVIDGLSHDKAIKPYRTVISQGGTEWLELKMKNGTFISLETFPNESRPIQYIVTLASAPGQNEEGTMISDSSGKLTSVLYEIAKGKTARRKA